MTNRFLLAAVIAAFVGTPIAQAQILYQANFNNAADLATWNVNIATTSVVTTNDAVMGFNYGTFGIPTAPANPALGGPAPVDTLGLRLRANVPADTTRPAGATSGLSVSPMTQNFGTAYTVSFWAWANFNGAANAAGLADNGASEGGTENTLVALGTAGNVPVVIGNTALVTNGQMDGVAFATTGDGGAANDYRAFVKGTFQAATSGVYQAGADATSTANTNTYYTTRFPSQSAPAAQPGLSTAEFDDGGDAGTGDAINTQLGMTQAGAFGFAWHYVVASINTDPLVNMATWDVDGSRFATIDLTAALPMGGNNFALGQSDFNATTTRHPSLVFSVFDNLAVTAVPEPGTLALVGLVVPVIWRFRRRGPRS